jgi:hypothetical protein
MSWSICIILLGRNIVVTEKSAGYWQCFGMYWELSHEWTNQKLLLNKTTVYAISVSVKWNAEFLDFSLGLLLWVENLYSG